MTFAAASVVSKIEKIDQKEKEKRKGKKAWKTGKVIVKWTGRDKTDLKWIKFNSAIMDYEVENKY